MFSAGILRVRATQALLVVLAAVLVLPAVALAQPYNFLPLHAGLRWDYDNGAASIMISTVEGHRVILSRETTVIRHIISGPAPQVVQNYWSTDEEGNLYLHGAENLSSGFVAVYEPPVLWLDVPLYVGKTWSSQFLIYYDYEGTWPGNPASITLTCGEELDLSVPAGTFHSFGVGSTEALPLLRGPLGERHDWCGRRLADEDSDKMVIDYVGWYSNGVGQVRDAFAPYGNFDLTSWNGPIYTLAGSWGQVKTLYR